MSEHDRIALLIPWFANGTLPKGERAAVEEHLPRCAACRELLEEARRQIALASLGPAERHLAHVAPLLLTQYAEEPASLETETVRWIEARLAECPACREAYELLVALEVEEAAPVPSPAPASGAWTRLWLALRASVLQPVPALFYLILLAALIPLWLAGERRGAPAPSLTAPVTITVTGETGMRTGAPREDRTAPLTIPAAGGPVLLRLETALAVSELDATGPFAIELRRGDTVIVSEPRDAASFAEAGGSAVLPVLLDPARVEPGSEYTIELRVRRPGSPLDGQALFRRRFVFSEAR